MTGSLECNGKVGKCGVPIGREYRLRSIEVSTGLQVPAGTGADSARARIYEERRRSLTVIP